MIVGGVDAVERASSLLRVLKLFTLDRVVAGVPVSETWTSDDVTMIGTSQCVDDVAVPDRRVPSVANFERVVSGV